MNKKLIIPAVIIIIITLLGGGFFVMNNKSLPGVTPTPQPDNQTINKLDPQDIGLQLVLSSDQKKVKVIAEDVKDVSGITYDVSYEADIPTSERVEGGETRTTRGFSDEATIKSGQAKYESKFFDLGSCSRNICRYDTGVEEIEILMKVVKRDGKIYQVEDSVKVE